MAINVNTVYQTVLMILNKEQRGYMTPTEFNTVSTQVQLEIFEKYFDDLNQQLRVPQADTDYADRQENIDEKLAIFKTFGNATYTAVGSLSYFVLPTSDIYGDVVSFYRLGNVLYNDEKVVQRLDRHEFYYANQSRLTKPSTINPAYLYENQKLFIKPTTIKDKIKVEWLKKIYTKELKIKRGFAYEQAVYDEINKAIKEFNIEGFKLSDGPTEVEGAADLVSTLFGQDFNVELKLEKPRYSSVTLKYDLNKLAPSILKNYPFNDQLIKMANDKKEAFKKYRERANELGIEMFGKDYVPMDQMGDALPKLS